MQIDNPSPQIIQERYSSLLIEKNTSISELEDNSDMDRGSLSKILSGKNCNPTISTLAKLANAFDMTASELFDKIYSSPSQNNMSQRDEADIIKIEAEARIKTKNGKWTIRLQADCDHASILDLQQIEEIVRQFGGETQTIIDIQEGSILIKFEGDLEGFEKIHALVKSGELRELAGFEILDIGLVEETQNTGTIINSLVSLRDWLQGAFEDGWLSIEQLLTPQQLAPSVFSSEQQIKIERAKQYQLGDYQINLVVEITQKNEEEVAIALKVYPNATETYLPANLRLTISADGEELPAITSREQTRLMQKLIDADFGDRFTLTLALENTVVIEEFEI